MATTTVVRGCDECGKSDDGPRHVFAATTTTPQTTLHFACCASRGCPTCTEQEK